MQSQELKQNGRGIVYVQNLKDKKIVVSITESDIRKALLKGVKINENF